MTVIWIILKSHCPNDDAAVLGDHKDHLVAKLIFLMILSFGDTTYLRCMKAIDLVLTVFLLPN